MSENEIQQRTNKSSQLGFGIIVSGCFRSIGVLTTIIVIGFFFVVITGISSFSGIVSSIGEFFGQPAVAQVSSTRTIVSGIQPLGQLVSVSVEVAQADIYVEIDSGSMNLCNHNANHVSQGAIEAGVDITQIEDDDISYDEASDTYTITLPAPAITSCRIEYIRQYERSGGNPTCGYDWDNVRLLAQYESTILFAEETLDAGILERAEREASVAIKAFVEALTGSHVDVIYAEVEGEPELPASCQPQLPRGWAYDDERNAWIEAQ